VAAYVQPRLKNDNLLAVFPDTYNFNAASFFHGLSEGVPQLATIGGGASEDGSVGETFQLCGDTVSNNAVCGLLLSGQFPPLGEYCQACQPIGPVHTVTESHQNLLLELDGRPAFEVFREVVRKPLVDDLRRAAAFVFVGLPVDSERQHIARAEYVVRNIVGFDPKQGVVAVADEIRQGQKMVFHVRSGDGAREDLKVTLAEQARAWEGHPPVLVSILTVSDVAADSTDFPTSTRRTLNSTSARYRSSASSQVVRLHRFGSNRPCISIPACSCWWGRKRRSTDEEKVKRNA
jgi:small ligand-binding sensory domain FIST